jgi:hypothetical protein
MSPHTCVIFPPHSLGFDLTGGLLDATMAQAPANKPMKLTVAFAPAACRQGVGQRHGLPYDTREPLRDTAPDYPEKDT